MIDVNTIAKSGLHDYEVINLSIDNIGANVCIQLKSPYGKIEYLKINNFVALNISHKEPWGKGSYVYSSAIESETDNKTKLIIELNSGDELSIQYTGNIEI